MKLLAMPAALLLISGCASEPAIQEGPDAEITYDGLHRIDNSAFEYAYIDPDADWARYDKFLPGGAAFQFRAVKKTSGTTRSRATTTEFYVDEKNRARLEEEVSKVFAEELGQSERFSVSDGPGPDVLVIRGGLTDVVSRVPPEYVGRSEVFLTSIGEATLVLEIVDSMSGEVLFRAADRRAADRMGGMTPARSASPTNWAEVRRLARRWALRLREGLDSLPAS